MGAFIPPRRRSDSPGATGRPRPGIRRWVRKLEVVVNVAILPVFALANVGVSLGGGWAASGAALRVLAAVAVARVIGKPLGIFLTTLGVTRVYPDVYQPRIVKRGLLGVGTVASIGFTVPLLIIRTDLGTGSLATAAVVGLLIGSVLGAAAGAGVLHSGPSRPEEVAAATGSPTDQRRVG
jgi:NhaA family Na+:H+ antiporter